MVAILADGETLEDPSFGTRSSFAAAHRDIIPLHVNDAEVPYRFEALLDFPHLSWIGDMLQGKVPPNSPRVIAGMERLFGTEKESDAFIVKI